MRTVLAAMAIAAMMSAYVAANETASRIDNFRVGDWVSYTIGNDENNVQRFTIKSISGEGGGQTIVFTVDATLPDGTTESQDIEFTRDEMFSTYDRYENYVVGTEEVVVAGKRMVAQITKMAVQSGQYLTIYWSYDVPFEGIIKVYADSGREPLMEIVDFGKK